MNKSFGYNPFGEVNKGSNNNRENSSYKGKDSKNSKYEYTEQLIEKIKLSSNLCNVLTIEEVNLPNRASYKVANEIKSNLKTNQLRKVFESIKGCEQYLPDVVKVRNEMYQVLPLIAYAVGRENCPREFFELMQVCINSKALQTSEDIKRLIEFLTAIVAYVKFFGK